MDYLFKGGYCAVFDNARQCGLIDRNGQWKVAPRYDYIYMPEEGLRILQKGDRWGVLGDSLQILMPVEYDWLKIVPEGIVCIQGGKQQVIGKDGKTVVRPFVYDAILPLSLIHIYLFIDNRSPESRSDKLPLFYHCFQCLTPHIPKSDNQHTEIKMCIRDRFYIALVLLFE